MSDSGYVEPWTHLQHCGDIIKVISVVFIMNCDTAQYFVGIRRALQGLTVHAFQPTVTATVTLTDAKAGLYSIAVTRVSRSMVMVLACLPHLKISFGTTYLWEQCRICMLPSSISLTWACRNKPNLAHEDASYLIALRLYQFIAEALEGS